MSKTSFVTVALTAVLLAGCGGGGDDAGTTSTSGTTSTPGATTPATSAPATSGKQSKAELSCRAAIRRSFLSPDSGDAGVSGKPPKQCASLPEEDALRMYGEEFEEAMRTGGKSLQEDGGSGTP